MSDIFKRFIYEGRIAIFTGLNKMATAFFLIQGIGYYGYLTRQDLRLANYTFTDSILIRGFMIAILSYISFLIAYRLTYKSIKKSKENNSFLNFRFKSIYPSKSYKWLLLLVIILLGFGIFWKLMGGIPFFIPNYNSEVRSSVGQGLGYIEAINISLIALSLLLFINIFRKKQFDKNAAFFLFVISSIYILSSDRAGLIGYFMTLWFIYSIYKGQPTIKNFSRILLLLIFTAGMMGVMKTNNRTNILLSSTIILTEVSVEFDNYNEVLNMTDKDGFLYGSTFIPIFTLPVPRSILPNKDDFLTAGNYFKVYHNHNHIRVGERMGFLGEFYLNFGLLGCLAGMAGLGIILAFLDRRLNKSSTLSVFFYIQLVTLFSGYAGDIPTVIISFAMRNLLLIIGVFIIFILQYNVNHNLYRGLVSEK